MKLVFENCWLVLPGHRVACGDLHVEDGRISAIIEKEGQPERLIMPGFVNCHGHTAMSLVRGLGSGLPLQRWLEEAIFPVEAKMTPEDVRAGMTWGAMEKIAGGTTCVADMYDFPNVCEEAAIEIGLRAHFCRVGLSFVSGRLQECVDFVRSARVDSVLTRRDFCIHSEYLTDEPFCRALADANREFHRPLHLHVSETRKEQEECIARHGKTPIAYLADTGLLDFGGYAAHCVWCTDDDFRIMAERKVSLVHNPTSNMKLGSGFARIVRAKELGVNVALGTDGCASNDNVNMFEEMYLASLLHKGLACDPTVLPPWEIIDMATVNGAKALGRDDIGELAVGKCADLAVIGLKRIHLNPCFDVPNLIVNSVHAEDVEMTVINGEIVYDHGQFMKIDQGRARFDFECAVRRLMK